MRFRDFALLVSVAVFLTASAHGSASFRLTTAYPKQFARIDLECLVGGAWTDPFDSDQVTVDLEMTSPSGKKLIIPCYFDSGRTETMGIWLSRFTPVEAGEYNVILKVTNGSRVTKSESQRISVAAAFGKGFLHPHDLWTLRFDNAELFRGVGENIGWEARDNDDSKFFRALNEDPRFNYQYLLSRLHEAGGNFFRTWMCSWNLPLEWKRPEKEGRYSDDDRRFNQSAAIRLDQLCEIAEATDTYFMLTLDPHGSFLGGWRKSSYNQTNGGPVATPTEFFSDPRAKHQYKDRLRYLVARWGFSTHLGIWEFFNEIDNAMYDQKPNQITDSVIVEWHSEMAEYLKKLDPYGRPITTSISHRDVSGLDEIPSIDINQKHIYRRTDEIPQSIARYSREFKKPYVIGEFAYEWDWSKNFDDFGLEMDRDLRHGLWLGLFSPTPILPMTWWWEYFDRRGTVSQFERVHCLSDEMISASSTGPVACEIHWAGSSPCTALGVRSGSKVFALVSNETPQAVSGAVSGEGVTSAPTESFAQDCGTGAYSTLTFAAGDKGCSFTIPPHADAVLVFQN